MTEEEILRRLRRGDGETLGRVVDDYGGYVGAIVWAIVGRSMTPQDAEEVCADVFVRLWQRADKVRPGSLKGYLAAISRSCAINALRRSGGELPLEEDRITLSAESAEALADRRERDARVRAAVDAMEEPDRTIFLRRYWYCQTAEDIADALGMTGAAVRKRLERGREKLRQHLQQEV